MKYLQFERTRGNIAAITVDCPDSKVNKVSTALLEEIAGLLDEIEKDGIIKGLVILSGKEDNFVVGADIDELDRMKTPEEVIVYITKAHDVLRRLEHLSIPVVCAIHGNCLGGGLELALVTDYRIASDSTKTVMGLPEVKLGIIPAAGGTQRLPRLIGLPKALPLMLTGGNVRPRKALKMGLIDEIVMPYGMKEAAVTRTIQLASGKARAKRKRALTDRILDATINRALQETSIGRNFVFSKAREQVMRQTFGHYPAALAIISSVRYGLENGIEKGLENDRRTLAKLVMDPKSLAMRSLFEGMTDLKKNPMKEQAMPARTMAVIGCGLMGHGIASVSTGICDTILMKDVSLEASARGMKEVWKGLDKQARSGAVTRFERDRRYGKLVVCEDYSSFRNAGLVIEAVFEDISLKKKVLADVEAATGERTIIASNTSALPIAHIAEGCSRPENVIGMHYFSPVPKMPLLEIIVTDRTAQWVEATALEFGIMQGKTCIVVKDGPGFYTTRILAPLLNEAVRLVEEGADPKEIDTAMKLFGYPVGPITLVDELGIDVAAHVAKGEIRKLFEERGLAGTEGYTKLFEHGFKGRKNGKGFYIYDAPRKRGLPFPGGKKKGREVNPQVYEILGGARRLFDRSEIQDRLALAMINEALFCLQEGIISCSRDGDIGAVFGLGFPPFTGGPFRYIDSVGAGTILERMKRLEEKLGAIYTPAEILTDTAKKKKRFRAGK